MDFIFLAIPVIFGIVSVYLANKAVSRGCKRKKALYMQIGTLVQHLLILSSVPKLLISGRIQIV